MSVRQRLRNESCSKATLSRATARWASPWSVQQRMPVAGSSLRGRGREWVLRGLRDRCRCRQGMRFFGARRGRAAGGRRRGAGGRRAGGAACGGQRKLGGSGGWGACGGRAPAAHVRLLDLLIRAGDARRGGEARGAPEAAPAAAGARGAGAQLHLHEGVVARLLEGVLPRIVPAHHLPGAGRDDENRHFLSQLGAPGPRPRARATGKREKTMGRRVGGRQKAGRPARLVQVLPLGRRGEVDDRPRAELVEGAEGPVEEGEEAPLRGRETARARQSCWSEESP